MGVANTENLYWIALGLTVVVYAAVGWISASRAGRLMLPVCETTCGVQVLGVRPYLVRLIAFVSAAVLATLLGMGTCCLKAVPARSSPRPVSPSHCW